MIRALEEHLANWMGAQLGALGKASGLFGKVITAAGDLGQVPKAKLGPSDIAVAVQVQGLTPATDTQSLGSLSAISDSVLRANCNVRVRFVGQSAIMTGRLAAAIDPPTSHAHRVDMAALAVLSWLKEPAAPGPTRPPAPPDPNALTGPSGTAVLAGGASRAQLTWNNVVMGEPVISSDESTGVRQWDVPLTATCLFQISPLALANARILQVRTQVAPEGGQAEGGAGYGTAEMIPLQAFEGLSDQVLTELTQYGVTVLGELGRLGTEGIKDLVGRLRTADLVARARLNDLANAEAMRAKVMAVPRSFRLPPAVLALPCRALLSPTPEESAILSTAPATQRGGAHALLMAVPVIQALRPEQRELLPVGIMVSGGR